MVCNGSFMGTFNFKKEDKSKGKAWKQEPHTRKQPIGSTTKYKHKVDPNKTTTKNGLKN